MRACAHSNRLQHGEVMPDRKIKICFWVEDVETKERIVDTQQCVMDFDTSQVEARMAEARERFSDATPEQIEKIVGIMPVMWCQEVITAGFLNVSRFARLAILKHLGYKTPDQEADAGQEKTLIMQSGHEFTVR
jgi:hypothetical protein